MSPQDKERAKTISGYINSSLQIRPNDQWLKMINKNMIRQALGDTVFMNTSYCEKFRLLGLLPHWLDPSAGWVVTSPKGGTNATA